MSAREDDLRVEAEVPASAATPRAEVAQDGHGQTGLRTVLGFVTANIGLAGAVLFYMGWAYTSAWLGYFDVNPLDLDIGVIEYVLRGLNLFSVQIVVAGAVTVVTITSFRTARPGDRTGRATGAWPAVILSWIRQSSPRLVRRLGVTATLAGVLGYLLSDVVDIPTYLLLTLLGAGPLMTVRTWRAQGPGRYAYALAIVTASVCGLWAAALYANAKGTQTGRNIARDLPSRTAAVVYSTERLALTGPGVRSEQLPKDSKYRYRYTGLRLLIARADRYYLLPVGWVEKTNATYVLRDADDLRIELYAGTR